KGYKEKARSLPACPVRPAERELHPHAVMCASSPRIPSPRIPRTGEFTLIRVSHGRSLSAVPERVRFEAEVLHRNSRIVSPEKSSTGGINKTMIPPCKA